MDAWREKLGWVRGALHETVWASAGPLLRLGIRCGGRLLAAGLLAGAALSGQPLFLTVGMVAACGGGVFGLAATAGAILGSVAFWGPLGALEQVAAALLCFCIQFVLRDLAVGHSTWLPPASAAGTAALLGGVALWAGGISQTGTALAVLRVTLAAVGALAFGRRDAVGQIFTYGALVLGAAAAPLPMSMRCGGLMAVFWTATAALGRRKASASAAALAGGAALELAVGGPYALALGLACLAARAVQQERLALRTAMFLLMALSVSLLFATPSPAMAGELVIGTLLGAVVPVGWLQREREVPDGRQRQLRLAADGLRALSRCAEQRAGDGAVDYATLFDRTAEQVCRVCGNLGVCWEQNSARTIKALEQIPPSLMEHGRIHREDLPKPFLETCRRPEAFTAALNHQLELRLCRRQGAVRLEELRAIQIRHGTTVARLLDDLAASVKPAPANRYRAVMGAAAAARNGEVVSGDAGSYCKGPNGRVYLLVCDGMGTGAEAARLSHAAVDVLSALLQAGAAPEDALSLLGGAYLLRGDGAFSTVDLAAVDLHNGETVIYKWGAAPSYLVTRDGVKRVGTATVPPGVSADEALAAETVRLSLGRGEMLVLISDGAGGSETERLLGAYDGCAPRELADRVVRAAQTRAAADDMTAAVLRLERVQ